MSAKKQLEQRNSELAESKAELAKIKNDMAELQEAFCKVSEQLQQYLQQQQSNQQQSLDQHQLMPQPNLLYEQQHGMVTDNPFQILAEESEMDINFPVLKRKSVGKETSITGALKKQMTTTAVHSGTNVSFNDTGALKNNTMTSTPGPSSRSQNITTNLKTTTPGPRSSKKLPPINLFDKTSRQIIDLVQGHLKINKFSIRKVAANKLVLQLEDIDDYHMVRSSLLDAKISNFTYTPAQEKLKCYILRGLDGDEEPEDVLTYLKELNLTDVQFIKVNKFGVKNAANRNSGSTNSSLFLVQVSADSSEAMLFRANKMQHVMVRCKKLRRTEIVQYHRCQRTGHVSTNCGMPFRCVKCKETHEPGMCKLPSGTLHDASEVFCVSCQKYGHPASFRGCPKIREFKERIHQRQEEQRQHREFQVRSANNIVRHNVSYAAMFSNSR